MLSSTTITIINYTHDIYFTVMIVIIGIFRTAVIMLQIETNKIASTT